MRALFLMLLCTALVSCAPNKNADNSERDKPSIDAPIALTLTDGGDGPWTVDIKRRGTGPLNGGDLYAFSRSTNDYRSETWQSVTGADFARKYGFDTITLTDNQAQLTLMPYSGMMQASYTPFIHFSDGGTAVFAGQFDMFALKDEAALEALGGDVYNNKGDLFAAPLTIKSSRPILYGGQSYDGEFTLNLDGKVSYAYVGETDITQGQDFAGVIDPGLPDWISGRFDDDLTLVFKALSERWGFGLTDKATILLAFEGYELEGLSATGGALPGNMIVMQLSGNRLREENPRILSYLQWFFTHEAAHLFQGHSDKHYAHNRYSWINEGGANTMTSMILVDKGLVADDYLQDTYSNSFKRCTEALEGKTLETAINNGPEGNYDCGDLIGRITDAALPDYDFFDFWNAFLDGLDGNFTDADYFKTMRALGANESVVSRLEALTSEKITDATGHLQSLMNDAGIKTTFVDGTMTAIAFPD
ncbi:hypothetical protein [Fretibacter rubidus]|uniref:hypothetical protein n=1 Tax=Fretibacter rubidus TaxID=570162 RepID=UPI00352ADF67